MIQRSVGLLAAVGVITLLVLSSTARGAAAPPFNDLPSYVKWVQKSHKAPFDRDGELHLVRRTGVLHFDTVSHCNHRSLAGQEGIEPPTCGFGDRRSAN